jgi:hypothetical protein
MPNFKEIGQAFWVLLLVGSDFFLFLFDTSLKLFTSHSGASQCGL